MSTHGGADAYLLALQLDGRLALADSLQMAVRVRLVVITSTYEALRDLSTFTSIASYLFSVGGRHSSTASEFFCLILIKYAHNTYDGRTQKDTVGRYIV